VLLERIDPQRGRWTRPRFPTIQPAPQGPRPSTKTLDQIAAPIALYPGPLIAQILAAAIYPIEIVEAGRWMQQGPSLNEAVFDEA
jgi:hypothetical protein